MSRRGLLPIRNSNKSKSSTQRSYLLDGFCLSTVSFISDLGTTIDSNLSFKSHISTIITTALQRVGVFFWGFSSRRLDIVRKTCITYIRPLLEYNSNVWDPSKKYLIDKIERVQRQFTKRIPSISNLSYLERLRVLRLEPLELRRLHFNLIHYYKIFNNLTSINQS